MKDDMPDALSVSNLCVRYGADTVLEGLQWRSSRACGWRITGESGSGKSSFLKALAGLVAHTGEVDVSFDSHSVAPRTVRYVDNWYKFSNLDGDRNFYYQQRYNKQEENETLTVFAELEKFGREENLQFEKVEPILEKFGFSDCRHTQLIELSSGEHKKLQLVCALWLNPQVLLLDEPYVGLDAASRANLNDLLDAAITSGTTLVIVANDDELPSKLSHFARLENGALSVVGRSETQANTARAQIPPVPFFLQKSPKIDSQDMFELGGVSVRYGEKTVLHDITWRVRAGEKWLLQGHNGSGKSTLLSLLDGDHPQAYSSNIKLFGRPRGSGESIWDIKEKIGIISPEMHWYFDRNSTVYNCVASGLKDTIGWFLDVSFEEQKQIECVLKFFGLWNERDKLLDILPLGKQRLAMLARTVVKNPQLLILDEPCQGLDALQTRFFNDILDALSVYGKTIIYVGHYETQLPKCLDHKLELDKGRIVYNGVYSPSISAM